MSSQNSGLATAMFLGIREELDPEQYDAFVETGAVHLIVIPGLNVGILAGCLLLLLRAFWVSERTAFGIVAVFTVLYALVAGAEPPVVRATVLVLLYCWARMLGRLAYPLQLLAAAGLVVLFLNPNDLFQVGTQLSFLAAAVLMVAGESKWFRISPQNFERLASEGQSRFLRARDWLVRNSIQSTAISATVWFVVQSLVTSRFT